MTKYFPAMLNIEGKKCVVIGGGSIAYRKCVELLQCKGKVTVAATEACQMLLDLAEQGQIGLLHMSYEKSQLQDAYLVIAATDNAQVNHQVFEDCSAHGILVNVVDDPQRCSFIVPAKIRRGDLTISVSTNGKCPMMSKRIKEELEMLFDDGHALLIEILGDLRPEIIECIPSPLDRKEFFERTTSLEYLEKAKQMSVEAMKQDIRSLLQNQFSQAVTKDT